MKKLGLILALTTSPLALAASALVLTLSTSQATATEAGIHYSNVAMVVAETGASIGWATQIEDAVVSDSKAQALVEKTSSIDDKLGHKLELRMAEMLEEKFEQKFEEILSQ